MGRNCKYLKLELELVGTSGSGTGTGLTGSGSKSENLGSGLTGSSSKSENLGSGTCRVPVPVPDPDQFRPIPVYAFMLLRDKNDQFQFQPVPNNSSSGSKNLGIVPVPDPKTKDPPVPVPVPVPVPEKVTNTSCLCKIGMTKKRHVMCFAFQSILGFGKSFQKNTRLPESEIEAFDYRMDERGRNHGLSYKLEGQGTEYRQAKNTGEKNESPESGTAVNNASVVDTQKLEKKKKNRFQTRIYNMSNMAKLEFPALEVN
ncbi:hypothetical protein LXL04_027690 [Taraxacum kok-saghyz]